MLIYNTIINNMYQKITLLIATTSIFLISFLWGFSEAIWFFIIPDIFLTLIALFSLKRALIAMAWTILGAMIGGAVLYWFWSYNFPDSKEFLLTVPLVSEKMIVIAEWHLHTYGFNGMFIGSTQGIPYKIYAALSGYLQSDIFLFLLATIPARAFRMTLSILFCAWASYLYKKIFFGYQKHLLITFAVIWIGIYTLYIHMVLWKYF